MKERPLALTKIYFFLHCYWKSEKKKKKKKKKKRFPFVALGAVPGEYIMFQVNNPCISVGYGSW